MYFYSTRDNGITFEGLKRGLTNIGDSIGTDTIILTTS